MSAALLEVRALRVDFPTRRGSLRALDGVSFDIGAGDSVISATTSNRLAGNSGPVVSLSSVS